MLLDVIVISFAVCLRMAYNQTDKIFFFVFTLILTIILNYLPCEPGFQQKSHYIKKRLEESENQKRTPDKLPKAT